MQVGFFKPLVPRRPCLTTLRRMTAQPTSTRFSQEDALFRTYLEDLPGPLLDALVKRKLTDPGLLRGDLGTGEHCGRWHRRVPHGLRILVSLTGTCSRVMRQLWSPHRHIHCLLLLLLSHSLTPTPSHIHLV